MPTTRHPSRLGTLELKIEIERKVGREKAERYFHLLSRFLNLKISKSEFDRHCIGTIGRENTCLHNRLIQAILRNASVAKTPPKESKKYGSLNVIVPNGYQRSSLQSVCRDVLPQSSQKVRIPNLRDRKFRDCPSPERSNEMLFLSRRQPPEGNSVEEGEEDDHANKTRSPIRAPFGVSINGKETRKVIRNGSTASFCKDSCLNCGFLPDTNSLKTRLERKLETEGLKISEDSINLLNKGLDVYLKRLINPCLALAGSRSGTKLPSEVRNKVAFGLNGTRPVRLIQKTNRPVFASLLDFRVAMESDPTNLGQDWPIQLEKIVLRASDHE